MLGFGLGGFFDGILLHQILQWHHLLSGVDGANGDLRTLVLADGLFHALMYVIVAAALWLLWQARRLTTVPGTDRLLFANALIGFGAWHIVDSILSHWVLGIHRIRMDSSSPLLWDLIWFFLFGVAAVAAGILIRVRGIEEDGQGGPGRNAARVAVIAAIILGAGAVSALPPGDGGPVMVLFRPGSSPTDAFHAAAALDGRVVWNDPSGQLWAIQPGPNHSPLTLYRHGALLVGNGILPAGCFNWSRV